MVRLIKKSKFIIINPGIIANELLGNSDFISKYDFEIWDSKKDSFQDLINLIEKNEGFLEIYLDELENIKIDSEILSLLNKYSIKNRNIKNLALKYEKFYKRIPIIHSNDEWIASKELMTFKAKDHVEIYKRLFDIIFVIIVIPFAAISTLIAAFLIKISSKGPILFKQRRVGKNDKVFYIYKMRTMVHNPQGHTHHTTKDDVRIFPIGKLLRKTKIDELPQLYNILVGEMSLIGPRPEKDDIVNVLVKENPYYELRHLIRPGITGWAQINNPTATPNQNFEKLEYDLYYVKNANLLIDIKIILKTIKIVLTQDSL